MKKDKRLEIFKIVKNMRIDMKLNFVNYFTSFYA